MQGELWNFLQHLQCILRGLQSNQFKVQNTNYPAWTTLSMQSFCKIFNLEDSSWNALILFMLKYMAYENNVQSLSNSCLCLISNYQMASRDFSCSSSRSTNFSFPNSSNELHSKNWKSTIVSCSFYFSSFILFFNM